MRKKVTGIDEAGQMLKRAQQAANQRDLREMLGALAASGYLDGLVRRLQKNWNGSLPPSEVDDCIASAVVEALTTVSNGKSIRKLGAWLWKVASNMATDKWRSDYAHRQDFDDTAMPDGMEVDETYTEKVEREEIEEFRRNEAIRIAREFLPQIGEGQVRDVMEIVIDAVENRIPDLPAASIAESVGIDVKAARTLVSRGLSRLRRLAKEEGFEMPTELPEIGTDHDKQEYFDD